MNKFVVNNKFYIQFLTFENNDELNIATINDTPILSITLL